MEFFALYKMPTLWEESEKIFSKGKVKGKTDGEPLLMQLSSQSLMLEQ